MEGHLAGLSPWWYVPEGQGGDYRYCGAAQVVEVDWPRRPLGPMAEGPPMSWQRNRALDDGHAAGATVVMTDDDLVRCAECRADTSTTVWAVPAADAVRLLAAHLVEHDLLYAGTPPTANPYFARRPHTLRSFVRDGLTAHRPNPIRYDTELPIKIDYDMTLQHLAAHGGALRCDHLLVWYRQRQRRGGCDWRTPEVEDWCAAYLVDKWGPELVRPHATRAHEVTLRWPRR
jgi:hypothetical protein